MYNGSHEEAPNAQQHGFDRDFWTGSPSDRMTKRHQVHVKPRSSMFDPHQCATSPIPAGAETVSRKTFLRHDQGRSVAEIEHDFHEDRDAWSGITEGARWTGVSVFRLAAVVTPRMVRTVKGRATWTGYSKPDVQPNRPRDVTERHRSRWSWEKSQTQQNWGWQETKPKQETWSWDTEPSKWSSKPRVAGVCRDSRDSGTESEEDASCESAHTRNDSPRQTSTGAVGQPITLPEVWNVALNPLRQVQCCHVKSGMACFQTPENPEVLNNLTFKGASVANRVNDDTGTREHKDSHPGRKRKDRHQSEQHKSKSKRCDRHRHGSHYMENQVMDH